MIGFIKTLIQKNHILGKLSSQLYSWIFKFHGVENYWEKRYASGGKSGAGSYGKFAEFKADVINKFVKENGILSIIEYGCGDGNQLRLFNFSSYVGFDISPTAIQICKELFKNDPTKQFKNITEYNGESAEMTMSLDVIYHLVDDPVYEDYMQRLFSSAQNYVVIYSDDGKKSINFHASHVRHRRFEDWIERNSRDWTLMERISNPYPYEKDPQNGTFADFFIYKKIKQTS